MTHSSTVQPVTYFFKRHPAAYSGLACVLVVAACLETLTVAAVFPLMTVVFGGDSSMGVGGRLLAVVQVASQQIFVQDSLTATALLFVGLMTLKSSAVLLRDYLIARGGAKVVHTVKQELFGRLRHAPYHYFLQQKQGEISYRLTSAPQSLALTLLLIPSAVAQATIILSLCVLLATISWQVTVLSLAFGAVLYSLIRQAAKRVSHVAGRQRTAALMKELQIVGEFVTGVKDILVARADEQWARFYMRQGEELRRLHVKDSVWQSFPGVAIEWVFFVLLVTIALAGRAVSGSTMTQAVPLMAVYAYALYRLIRALTMLSQGKLRLSGQLADVELLYHALHEPLSQNREGNIAFFAFTGAVEFDRVSFTYPGRPDPVLSNVSFWIPKGGTTAIVGRSGVGKTTLINLLLRLYEPTGGMIRVDGHDLGQYRRDSWLRQVGYVSQEVFLFNGTVEENIRFGLTECSAADVEEAAHAAYAHDFIRDLPQGYVTVVGDRGMTLSGGQRQRIAIARALLRKPEILIFDEATSALDSVSEALIQKAIAELAHDHTMILVAHRISTVRSADQIVVLDGGMVVECGSPEALLRQGGHYARMAAVS